MLVFLTFLQLLAIASSQSECPSSSTEQCLLTNVKEDGLKIPIEKSTNNRPFSAIFGRNLFHSQCIYDALLKQKTHKPEIYINTYRSYAPQTRFDLAWSAKNLQPSQSRLRSRLEGMYIYDDKATYFRIFQQFERTQGNYFRPQFPYKVHQDGYVLNFNSLLMSEQEVEFVRVENLQNEVYFIKDPQGLDGHGLSVTNDLKPLQTHLKLMKSPQRSSQDPNLFPSKSNRLFVQKQIKNPLLLEGKKFDIRNFIFLFCTGRHFVMFYHQAYIRMSLYEYNQNEGDLKKQATHTTHAKKFADDKELHYELQNQAQRNQSEYEELMFKYHNFTKQQMATLYHREKQALVFGFLAGIQFIKKEKGGFHLFGNDVMFDQDLHPWLLEINVYPGLHIFTDTKQETMGPLARDVVKLLLQFNDNYDNLDEFVKNQDQIELGEFEIVYNDANGYNILLQQ